MIDAQIGHEKTLTALLPAMAGSNIIYGMGMLELGITFNFAQLLIDAEIVRMIQRVLRGMPVHKDTLAVEVIKSVGAGGNYLGELHTATHFRKEQSAAKLIDRTMRDVWEENGGKDMKAKAEEAALAIIKNHRPLPLPANVAKGLQAIIAEAEEEKGLR